MVVGRHHDTGEFPVYQRTEDNPPGEHRRARRRINWATWIGAALLIAAAIPWILRAFAAVL